VPAEATTRSSAMSESGLVMTLLVNPAPGVFVQPVVKLAANSSSLAPVVVSGPLSLWALFPHASRSRRAARSGRARRTRGCERQRYTAATLNSTVTEFARPPLPRCSSRTPGSTDRAARRDRGGMGE